MEPESQSGSRTRFKRRSNGDVVVTESMGSGLRKFAYVAIGIAGAVGATFAVSRVASLVDFDFPPYVPVVVGAALLPLALEYFVPAHAVLRVRSEVVTVQTGRRSRQVLPISSVRYAEHVLVRSPDQNLAAPNAAADYDRRYGSSDGFAVRIHYIHEDLSVRSLTFVTSEARRVIDALKQVGVRVDRP
ncbi:hypothetical protein [Candidatus Poriferisodalis sp.]|uniref:hypothetical protein n=1 Tax=Candidatus Poriferisodalis sp. TaxID=3101277 RepID=UPI003B522476